MSDAPNAGQTTYWNELGGLTWAELSPLLDRQIEPLGEAAVAALAPRPGERILDVGCGCGQTSLDLGRRVGGSGEVLGLDISRPMLEIARHRAEAAGAANVRFVEGDAQTWPLPAERFDALFSRFGVMFFADPVAAFRNLLGALRPGGRIAFACWRAENENPLMTTPARAAATHLPPSPPTDPDAPGPFAFADPAKIRRILEAAGFDDVETTPCDTEIGGNTPEDSLTLALRIGPLGARLRENPELRPKVVEDVRRALAEHVRDGRVWMKGAVWIVTACRP